MFQKRVPPTSKYPTTASLVTEQPIAPIMPPGTSGKVEPVAAVVEVGGALVELVDVVVALLDVAVEAVESMPAVDEV